MNFKNKKGSLSDTIYGPAKLLILAITAFIGVYVWFAFSDNFQFMTSTLNAAQNTSIQTAIANVQIGLQAFDFVFPFLIIIFLIVSLIFAFKTGANMIYALFSIIMWVLALIISAVFTNIFEQFQTTFPTVASFLPIVVYFMTNMKWVVLFWLFLITVVIFSRNKRETEAISASEMAFTSGGYS